VRVLVTTALVFSGSGCATKEDCIDRTQVTVDVTGVWQGNFSDLRNTSYGRLTLTQSGAKVRGTLDLTGHVQAVPVEGIVTGDSLRFWDARNTVIGELQVHGDEMTGPGKRTSPGLWGGDLMIHLRREP